MNTMFIGFIFVLCFVVWGGSIAWCVGAWMGECKGKAASTMVCILVNSVLIGFLIENEQENPCVQYEERMSYNAVTKTMMPMRVCIERGEWVEQ